MECTLGFHVIDHINTKLPINWKQNNAKVPLFTPVLWCLNTKSCSNNCSRSHQKKFIGWMSVGNSTSSTFVNKQQHEHQGTQKTGRGKDVDTFKDYWSNPINKNNLALLSCQHGHGRPPNLTDRRALISEEAKRAMKTLKEQVFG